MAISRSGSVVRNKLGRPVYPGWEKCDEIFEPAASASAATCSQALAPSRTPEARSNRSGGCGVAAESWADIRATANSHSGFDNKPNSERTRKRTHHRYFLNA